MRQSLSVLTLGVGDLQRSLRFYRDGLGWTPSNASVDGEVAFFKCGGIVVALWGRDALEADSGVPGGDGAGAIALAHNTADREEVDQILREVVSAGGTITRAAQETDWGGYNGYFADPDGFVWEVAWNPHWPLNADGSVQLPD